jgi:hypothetical protein
MARLAEAALRDRLPDVGPQKDLESDSFQAQRVEIHPEKGAEGVRFKFTAVSECDVEAIEDHPE